MKNHHKNLLRIIFRTLVILSLPLQVLLLQLVASQPLWVEQFYTGSVYKYLSFSLRYIFGWLPLPVGQFLFYGLIFGVLYWIVNLVKKLLKKTIGKIEFFRMFGFGVVLIASAFYFLFNVLWGLNYYRQPVKELTHLDTSAFKPQELKAMSERLIALTNQNRRSLQADSLNPMSYPLSNAQIIANAPAGFRLLSQNYPAMQYEQPSVKKVLVPELMSYFGIAGIYFPFTGEANVNMDPPPYLLPSTVCHEMAHQLGVASEDEANFVAYLACRQNAETAFQYAGNLMATRYTLSRLYWEDSVSYYQYVQQLSPGVLCDLEASKNYWNSFENPVEIVGRVIHDLFLKANNQNEGVRSYSRVVELLIGEYRKNKLTYSIK